MSDGIADMLISAEALRSNLAYQMDKWGAKYELQYSDYTENQWTAPVLLTTERIEQIVSDFSIKNIRISFSI